MTCSALCNSNFYSISTEVGLVPKCPRCSAPMKPHAMFFDEGYCEKLYRSQSVTSRLGEIDSLIVVGTSLQTGLARHIVDKAISNKLPTIELNYELCIEKGKVL